MIRRIIAIIVNLKSNVIQIKSVRNTKSRTFQTNIRAILIRPVTVTIDASNTNRKAIRKSFL